MAGAEHMLLEIQGLITNMQQEIEAAMEVKKRQAEEAVVVAAAAAAAQEKQKELQKQEVAKGSIPDPLKQPGRKPQKDGWYSDTHNSTLLSFTCLTLFAIWTVNKQIFFPNCLYKKTPL